MWIVMLMTCGQGLIPTGTRAGGIATELPSTPWQEPHGRRDRTIPVHCAGVIPPPRYPFLDTDTHVPIPLSLRSIDHTPGTSRCGDSPGHA